MEIRYIYVKEADRVFKAEYYPIDGTFEVDPTTDEDKIFSNLASTVGSVSVDFLTKENILDYPIKEEDLDRIIEWTTDIDLYEDVAENFVREAVKEGIKKISEQDKIDMNHAGELLLNLKLIDPDYFTIITILTDFLSRYSLTQDLSGLEFDLISGSGVNVRDALNSLKPYVSNEKKVREQEQDLVVAIVALLTEYKRRIIHNLD